MPVAPPLDRRRDHERRHPSASVEALLRDTARLLDGCGVGKSPSWVRRTVRDYVRHAAPKGLPFGHWLAARVRLNDEQRRRMSNDPAWRYVLVYSDPTGEEATRRALRGAR